MQYAISSLRNPGAILDLIWVLKIRKSGEGCLVTLCSAFRFGEIDGEIPAHTISANLFSKAKAWFTPSFAPAFA